MHLQNLGAMPSPTDISWKRIPSKHRPRISSLDDVVEVMEEEVVDDGDQNNDDKPLMLPKLIPESAQVAPEDSLGEPTSSTEQPSIVDDVEQTISTTELTKPSPEEASPTKESQSDQAMKQNVVIAESNEHEETVLLNDTDEAQAMKEGNEKMSSNDDKDADVYDTFAKVDSELSMLCAEIMSDSENADETAAHPDEKNAEEKNEDVVTPLVSGDDDPNPHDGIIEADDQRPSEPEPKEGQSTSQATTGDRQSSDKAGSIAAADEGSESQRTSLMSWISHPFGGSVAGETITVSIDNKNDASKVETLSTYDNAPVEFENATQSVRNYHANVQTLQSCETAEQKEMCRIICDDTYKLACRLVAEKGENSEHTAFQTRLLDDLRMIREAEKTMYAEVTTLDTVETTKELSDDASIPTEVSPNEASESEKFEVGGSESAQQGESRGLSSSTDRPLAANLEQDVPINQPSDNNAKESEQPMESNDISPQAGHPAVNEEYKNDKEPSDPETAVVKPVDNNSVGLSVESDHSNAQKRGRSPVRRTLVRNVQEPPTGGLFDQKGEAIYQVQEEPATKALSDSQKNPNKVSSHTKTRGSGPSPPLQMPFRDKKGAVKFLVTMLTGYDVELNEKSLGSQMIVENSDKEDKVVDSIFDCHRETDDDSSSLSTCAEDIVREELEVKGEEDTSQCAEDDDTYLFDFMPSKHNITVNHDSGPILVPTKGGPAATRDSSVERALVRQFSNASLAASLESSSTRRSLSLSRSPRRKAPHRLRRQGGSRSGPNSLAPTPIIRSPQETPVEERSLVDGKPAELTIPDHGGEVVKWDHFYDTEEMSGALDRTGMLDDALMTFSSLENAKALLKVPLPGESDKKHKTFGTLVWRRLLANWKHAEVWKALQTVPTSELRPELEEEFDDDESSFSTNDSLHAALAKNEDILMRFLCDIGPTPVPHDLPHDTKDREVLRHHIQTAKKDGNPEDKAGGDRATIENLETEAKVHLDPLERLLTAITQFASQNCLHKDFGAHCVSSVNVKDVAATRRKADRKYSGDVLQVKDILRGQITFPDEGALICGLYSLHRLAGDQRSMTSANVPVFQIVRMKNLFRMTGSGTEYHQPLPT
ncbi:MAG: hypothetical protein SGILL_007199, partial [Bacillariaceae sp.]